jgi:hypothetical protein
MSRALAVAFAVLFLSLDAQAAGLREGWSPFVSPEVWFAVPPFTRVDTLADAHAWKVRGPKFSIQIELSPSVGDGDDSEPRICYTAELIALGAGRAVLRVSRPHPRLDCPENYASLYVPAAPGRPALYLSARADEYADLDAVRAVVTTIHVTAF